MGKVSCGYLYQEGCCIRGRYSSSILQTYMYFHLVDNNDELSRDSPNYVSDSSRSAVNFRNSNSVTPTMSSMLRGEELDGNSNSNSFIQGSIIHRKVINE